MAAGVEPRHAERLSRQIADRPNRAGGVQVVAAAVQAAENGERLTLVDLLNDVPDIGGSQIGLAVDHRLLRCRPPHVL